MPISLILADDHPLVLKGLELLLSTEPDFTVLAYCTDGEQVLQAVRRQAPAGAGHPGARSQHAQKGWLDGAARAAAGEPVAPDRPAALSEDEALDAVRLGVRGMMLKEMAPQLLLECLRKVQAGEEWLEKRSFRRALGRMLQREDQLRQALETLTLREIALTRLVAKGLTNQQIADEFHISEGTVKVHLHHIYAKLGVRNRVGLTMYAQEKGLA